MAKTFMQMVQEAKAEVPGVGPVEAQRRFREDPDALLLEVRDPDNIPVDEKAPDMVNISLGTLPIRADLEVPEERRDPRFGRRNYDIHPDGDRFLMIKRAETSEGLGNQVILVQTWFEELKRLVPTD